MHPKGGVELALAMSTSYSTKQLYDILEMLDVHDTFVKIDIDKKKSEANKNKGQP